MREKILCYSDSGNVFPIKEADLVYKITLYMVGNHSLLEEKTRNFSQM